VSGDIITFYRARLARETGTVRKDWGGRLSVALCFPSYYRLGMSNLGFQLVYHLCNTRPDVVAERVFLPEGREMSLYIRSGRPLLSLESQTPLQAFDLVAFSISFENDYPNVLKILELGRIPLLSEERTDSSPFVMAGGVSTFLNPEPLAPFVDFFLLGEAEANLFEFIDLFSEVRSENDGRKRIEAHLAARMDSLYVPSLYEPRYNEDGTLASFLPKDDKTPEKVRIARRVSVEDEVPVSTITTPETEFADRVLIEAGRGCGRSCRFCAAGYVYRPPRFHEESVLRSSIVNALERCDQVGLVSAALSDVPGIEDLTSMIVELGKHFSVSSLRADALTPALLHHLDQAGQRTLAIAPEAGSDRLRRLINKHLTREQIISAVNLIAGTGPFSLRLYFLLGLPTETGEDVAEIVELVKVIRHHMIKESAPRGRIGRIRLSVNCFVPKPFTPFQWFPLEDFSSLKEKQKRLRKALTRMGGVDVNFDVPKWAYVQTLLSMGDRRVGSILLRVHKSGGNWTKALRHSDVNPDFFVYRPREYEELLPWDFVDHGIKKRHLIHEYQLALEEKESDICDVGNCFRCGVCGREKIATK